jgi:hypothetical protein
MKYYISGKISGLSQEEAYDKFEKAEQDVIKLGFTPVNPMKLIAYDPKLEWEDYMSVDIDSLLRCKGIYLLPDWGSSRGARCEYAIAKELGLDIIFKETN